MQRIRAGAFLLTNPYNAKTSTLLATPQRVHTIVFWSKNFGPFLQGRYGEALEAMGFNLFFNFTINSTDRRLEPFVPPLSQRLDQLEALCRRFGPRAIFWRFDPVCVYRLESGPRQTNLADFEAIARRAAAAGVGRCVTSFMDHYPKISGRLPPGMRFEEPDMDWKLDVVRRMRRHLVLLGMDLRLCCESDLVERLVPEDAIRPSACVPNDLLMEIYGGTLSVKKDSGQRLSRGCGCRVSVDIGDYRRHPCFHNCLFCYASPADPGRRQTVLALSPAGPAEAMCP